MNTPTKEELAELRSKHTIKQIAQHYGKSANWVEKLIQKYGLTKREYYGNSTKEKPSREELKSFLFDHTYTECASHFGFALKTIQKLMVSYDLTEYECKHSFIDRETLEKLRNDFSIQEIALQYNVSKARIERLIKDWNIEIQPIPKYQYTIQSPELISSLATNFNQQEIADQLGVSKTAVLNAIERFEIDYERKCPTDFALYGHLPASLTQDQKEVLNGFMLGDGSIPCKNKDSDNVRNNRFSFGQKEINKEYVELAYEILSPFSTGMRRTTKVMNGKEFPSWMFRTSTHPLFTELREKWYLFPNEINSQKIIPDDLTLTWQTIAYWYADDGCNSRQNKAIYLFSQSFTKDDNEKLQEMLENFSIKSSLNRRKNDNWCIRIPTQSYQDFIDGVSPFLKPIKCLRYKIKHKESQ
jgi:predicted DNA-binding protein YlxM (UPF0122 family)